MNSQTKSCCIPFLLRISSQCFLPSVFVCVEILGVSAPILETRTCLNKQYNQDCCMKICLLLKSSDCWFPLTAGLDQTLSHVCLFPTFNCCCCFSHQSKRQEQAASLCQSKLSLACIMCLILVRKKNNRNRMRRCTSPSP